MLSIFSFPRCVALSEFKKREQAVVATFGELQAQASAVMDVISNPEVVSALRQDKLHNLAYLKDNHAVCPLSSEPIKSKYTDVCINVGYPGTNRASLQIRSIPILHWTVCRSLRLPLPFPSSIHRLQPRPFLPLG